MTLGPVLISAGTSIVVTLMIEFLAKPYAEARKDRILEKYRALRTVRISCGRIMSLASALATDMSTLSPEHWKLISAEHTKMRDEIATEARGIQLVVFSYGDEMPSYVPNDLGSYAGYVIGAAVVDGPREVAAANIIVASQPFVDYFKAKRLRRLGRRRRLKSQLKQRERGNAEQASARSGAPEE